MKISKSTCCDAWFTAKGGEHEGAAAWRECEKCGKACDIHVIEFRDKRNVPSKPLAEAQIATASI